MFVIYLYIFIVKVINYREKIAIFATVIVLNQHKQTK